MIRQNLRYSMLLTLAICTLVGVASTAQARTWRVARNGSGDFMIVAEAVEAAASGDTISIAPGDYPEVVEYQTPSRAVEMIGYVLQGELTIIGDDRESVILGTPTQAPNIELGPTGIVVAEGCTLQLRGVTIRNSGRGIDCNGSGLDVRDCRFVGGDQGVTYVGEGFTTVVDCVFENQRRRRRDGVRGSGRHRCPRGELHVPCQRVGNRLPTSGLHRARQQLRWRNGRGSVGVQVSFGGSALIERCAFTAIRNVGVGAVGGSQVHLYDCVFEPTMSDECVNRRAPGWQSQSPRRGHVQNTGIHRTLHHRLPRESYPQRRRVFGQGVVWVSTTETFRPVQQLLGHHKRRAAR